MVVFDHSRCVGCGLCADDCLPGAIRIQDRKAHFLADHNCMQCGHCIAICPRNAAAIPDLSSEPVSALRDLRCEIDPVVVADHMRARRSIRHFSSDALSDEQLRTLLNVGRFSPTGGNRQTVRYNIVRSSLPSFREQVLTVLADMAADGKGDSWYPGLWLDMHREYEEVGKDRLFFGAGTVLLVSSDSAQAACIASAHIETMANALKLGVLYSGFTVRAISASVSLREFLDLRDGYSVWTALVLGKPLVTYQRTVPRNAADVVWD